RLAVPGARRAVSNDAVRARRRRADPAVRPRPPLSHPLLRDPGNAAARPERPGVVEHAPARARAFRGSLQRRGSGAHVRDACSERHPAHPHHARDVWVDPRGRALVPRRDHGSSAAVTPLPGIDIMTVLTLAAGGGFAVILLRAIGRPVPLWLLALPLPLSAAVNLLVKRPIYVALAGAASVNVIGPTSPFWFLIAVWLLPPVSEAGIKLATLFLPFVRRRIRGSESAVLVGAAVGLGFGLGEALYVGY